MLMQFLFHFFPSHDSFLELFGHSVLDLLFPLDFLFGYFNNGIEVDLNALNKIKLFSNLLVELVSVILVHGTMEGLIFFGEVSQLLFVIKGYTCELLIKISEI